MWKPKQLLSPAVIKLLVQADFPSIQIEFLGWLPKNAYALNNSRNAVKAAHTCLASEGNLKMIDKFIARKQESVRPAQVTEHTEADEKFREFNQWSQSQFPEEEDENEYPAEN